MLVHQCLITLTTFSVDDESFWNNDIPFIHGIELSYCSLTRCMQKPLRLYISDYYRDFSLNRVDSRNVCSHSILYCFTNIYTSNFCTDFFKSSFRITYCSIKYLAFILHFTTCDGVGNTVVLPDHVNNDFGQLDQACFMDQESDEIQCECSNWKYTRNEGFRSFNHCYCTFYRCMLFLTHSNDLFILKQNRCKPSALCCIYVI